MLTFLDMTIDKVSTALKFTSQKSLMLCKSPLSIVAAVFGVSTIMIKLESSAKRRIDAPIFLTISLMNIRNRNGPRVEP